MAVYAISDLHGSLNLFKQIQSFTKKDDTIYVLGDCGDRGNEPWQVIKEVAKDKRFVYLKGNHEDMLVKALNDYKRDGDIGGYNCLLLFQNGGYDTFLGLSEEDNADAWSFYLKKRPVLATYVNKDKIKIYLCHAGFSPYKDFKSSEIDFLWDRDHYFDLVIEWEDCIVVHGHTPIPYICKDLNLKNPEGALWYANSRKVCIDKATYQSKKIVLLNLDTFEEIIFEEED